MSDTCDHCGGRVGQYSHGCPGCGAPQCCQLCCTGNHEALHAEVERLTVWVDDLQSGMYVNCVYCGHRYGPGETTPVSMSDALKAHVEQCPQHPMSALRAEVERLRAELDEIASVLPGVAYMDPPDGGSPSIAEQVRRMRADLDRTAAEVERLKAVIDFAPHQPNCASHYAVMVDGVCAPGEVKRPRSVQCECDCWKRAARGES